MWKTLEQSISSELIGMSVLRGKFVVYCTLKLLSKQQTDAGRGWIPTSSARYAATRTRVPGADPGLVVSQPRVDPGHCHVGKQLPSFLQCDGAAEMEMSETGVIWTRTGIKSTHPSTANKVFQRRSSKHYGMGPQKKSRKMVFQTFKGIQSSTVVSLSCFVFSLLTWDLETCKTTKLKKHPIKKSATVGLAIKVKELIILYHIFPKHPFENFMTLTWVSMKTYSTLAWNSYRFHILNCSMGESTVQRQVYLMFCCVGVILPSWNESVFLYLPRS